MNLLRTKGALWAGVSLMILGLALLFWTNPIVHWLANWWPLVLTFAGIVCLFKFFFRQAKPRYLLSGLILSLQGLLIQAISLGVFNLAEVWPAFAAITGAAFIPYSFQLRRRARLSLRIPAAVLLFFSSIFFIFSYRLVPKDYSFTDLATQWWPAILLVSGLVLILSYYFSGDGRKKDE